MNDNNLKILLIGQMQAQDIEFSYKRAFERLGCGVEAIDPNDYYSVGFLNRILNKILNITRGLRIFFGLEDLNEKILKKAEEMKPNIVFWGKPIHVKPETVVRLQSLGAKVFAWYPDDVLNFRNMTRNMRKAIPLYDCNFSPRKFAPEEFYGIFKAKKSEFLPFAANTDLYYPEEVSEGEKKTMGADIVFVGNYYEKYRAEVLERLCGCGYDLKVYGNKWERFRGGNCLSQKALMRGPAERDEYRRVINASKIALAFLSKTNRDQHSHRGFEITACGAFLLHEWGSEEAEFYKEGEEAEFFRSFGELKNKIDYYLQHEEERKKIAEAGLLRARSHEHSYLARAEKVINTYFELLKEK